MKPTKKKAARKAREYKMWACVSAAYDYKPLFASTTAEHARRCLMMRAGMSWTKLHAEGWRCVRVVVKEVV